MANIYETEIVMRVVIGLRCSRKWGFGKRKESVGSIREEGRKVDRNKGEKGHKKNREREREREKGKINIKNKINGEGVGRGKRRKCV